MPAPSTVPEVGIGLLGYAFMGKAHSNAYKTIPYMVYPPPAVPRLVALAGRDAVQVAEAAQRYGFETSTTDWRDLVADPRVHVFDNGGPNDVHAAACIAAAAAGKHVICEKPLARNAEEAARMRDAVVHAGVKHMVAFNYRFVPALAYVRRLIEQGALGRIYHFRAVYLQERLHPAYGTPWRWRHSREQAGSGALGDLGSHIIDLAHFLVGDIAAVSAMTRTFITERPLPDGRGMGPVDVDDAFAASIQFGSGAIGTIEATRYAVGHKNYQAIEINAERGSVRFNLERLNELDIFWVDDVPQGTAGFRNVLVTESHHPWLQYWWPAGHIIGWEHTFVHELAHFLDCVAHDRPVAPMGATFVDGYRATVVTDAILESAASRRQVDVVYAS